MVLTFPQVVSIYEILRRFQTILRLSPFRLEDFCAALSSEDQSNLLSEVHLSLLKTLIRYEANNQHICTRFGSTLWTLVGLECSYELRLQSELTHYKHNFYDQSNPTQPCWPGAAGPCIWYIRLPIWSDSWVGSTLISDVPPMAWPTCSASFANSC